MVVIFLFFLSKRALCEYFKVNDAIDTIINTKLGTQALESGLDTLYVKGGMAIVDDAMHLDIKQWMINGYQTRLQIYDVNSV